MVFYSKIIKFFTISALLILLAFCSSDDDTYVPDVPVYVELNLYNELSFLGVGQTVSIIPDSTNTESSYVVYPNSKMQRISIPWKTYGKGLIIYRDDSASYLAFDRTCTYKTNEQYCGVEIGKNILIAVCPCCGSKYMLTADAVPTNDSKAVQSLVEYQSVVTDNGTRLIIRN